MKHLSVLTLLFVSCLALPATKPSPRKDYRNVVLTDNPDSKTPKMAFTPGTAEVYAFFEMVGIRTGDKLKGVFICEKSTVAPPNHKIAQAVLAPKTGMTVGHFSLTKPTKGWPLGNYRVDLYLNGVLKKSAKFTVFSPSSRPQYSLVGTWTSDDKTAEGVLFEFRNDGTMTMTGPAPGIKATLKADATYTVEGNIATLRMTAIQMLPAPDANAKTKEEVAQINKMFTPEVAAKQTPSVGTIDWKDKDTFSVTDTNGAEKGKVTTYRRKG